MGDLQTALMEFKRGPLIVCRTIEIPEAELLEFLHIDDADAAGYQLWRRLFKLNPNLTPHDVAHAVREMRPAVELWIDAVAAKLDRLQPRPRRRRHRRGRHGRRRHHGSRRHPGHAAPVIQMVAAE